MGNTISATIEEVEYIYVNCDIMVSGERYIDEYTAEDETYSETITQNAFNLSLLEGWNAIYWRCVFTESWTDDHHHVTATYTTEVKNPNILWDIQVNEEDEYYIKERNIMHRIKSRLISIR